MHVVNAPKFRIKQISFIEREVRLRLPFRFGVVTLKECPQVYVKVDVEFKDATLAQGCSSEMMVPKWFDKNMDLSNEDNFNQLRLSLKIARTAYLAESSFKNAWEYFSHHYSSIIKSGEQNNLNHLTSNFGIALIDKALIDALCHYLNLNFYKVINHNHIGLKSSDMSELSDLKNFDLNKFLISLSPSAQIDARHTIGLLDAIDKSDDSVSRPEDTLPVTLKDVVNTYGHRYYKIKLCGNLDKDIIRLKEIAPVIQDVAIGISLDGNEQFVSGQSFLEFFNVFKKTKDLEKIFNKILFIEQPIHRDQAMKTNVEEIAAYKPLLIDESDADLDTFVKAVDLGYRGVSSKSCKGVYKSLINAARCKMLNDSSNIKSSKTSSFYFQTGEDLTMQPGVGIQQDLALVSLLGLTHVERNGHHYVNGMQGIPLGEQSSFLAHHTFLYTESETDIRLQIKEGLINLSSLSSSGFATCIQGGCIDWNSFNQSY